MSANLICLRAIGKFLYPNVFKNFCLCHTVLVVCGLQGCSVYLDDLVVYSDTWHSRLQHIHALFEPLAEAQLTINLAKCDFAMATVTYSTWTVWWGRAVGPPVWAKVMAIADYPQPKTKKELQRFWGLVGYYITELLKAKVKFVI